MTNALLPPRDIDTVYRRLADAMPGRTPHAKGPKDQPDAFRACLSCMMSAQSRDENTAMAAATLFALADTPHSVLDLTDEAIAAAIRPCGLYNVKTRNIRRFCEALIAEHGGVVPDTRAGLMALPGIGRKCADIVLSFTFGHHVIAVDTHVHRVCNRIGLATGKTGEKTARSLAERSPDWALRDGHFWLIQFGKRVCTARAPKCHLCPLADLCQWYIASQQSKS